MSYETNERIPSLTDVRRRERENAEKKITIDRKELLYKAISYYNDNYPNSTHKNIWKNPKIELELGIESLEEELKKLDESKLFGIHDIFTYYHDERQMPKVSDHRLRTGVISLINKIFPIGDIIKKLHALRIKQKEIELEIIKKEDILKEERKEFINRLETEQNKKTDFSCKVEGCGKICKSQAGLKSHSRSHINEQK